MKNFLLLLCLALIGFASQADDGFSTVEERMTGKEFMETGLNKLSEEELAALNRWLRNHSVATLGESTRSTQPAVVAAAEPVRDRRGLEGKDADKSKIISRLVGEFTGWDGETIFTLENGMVWKQDETDKFFTKSLTNPMITIKPGMWNAWRLSVEGYNKSLQVKRIQ